MGTRCQCTEFRYVDESSDESSNLKFVCAGRYVDIVVVSGWYSSSF